MSERPDRAATPNLAATYVSDGDSEPSVDESGFMLSSSSIEVVPELELAEGSYVGKFVVQSRLGKGGMGAVFRAHDPDLDRDVAIKVLSAEFASDESARRRFAAEGRAAGKLSHPNIVAVFDVGDTDGRPYLVMEYVTGGAVDDLTKNGNRIEVQRATEILADACAGLAAAHHIGLIHRDIKPANLMIDGEGVVKVADFGLARATNSGDPRLTQAARIVGTPFFMSPEQCSGQELNHQTDIYSLGATYYALLTGHSPYESVGSMMDILAAHIHEAPPEVHKIVDDLPPACTRLINRAMAKSRDDRYANVEEMLIDAEALIEMVSDPKSREKTTYRGATSCVWDSYKLASELANTERQRTISQARSKDAKRTGGSSIITSLIGTRKSKKHRASTASVEPKDAEETKVENADGAITTKPAAATEPIVLPSVTNPAPKSLRREVFSLNSGEFVILCPSVIAEEELPELTAWLKLIESKITKAAQSTTASTSNSSVPPQHSNSPSTPPPHPKDPSEPARTVVLNQASSD